MMSLDFMFLNIQAKLKQLFFKIIKTHVIKYNKLYF